MNKENIKNTLLSLGFSCEYDKEYNREVYTNKLYFVANRNTKLVIYICYYTIRFEWWYEENKKVGTSFYIKDLLKFDVSFIEDTITDLQNKYKIN